MKIVFDWQDNRYFTDRFYLNGRCACSILKVNGQLPPARGWWLVSGFPGHSAY